MKIAPSILAADQADLASALQVCERGGAEMVHFDVMDGHFVPNLSFGIPVLEALAARTDLDLDVHLMVSNPDRLLDDYLAAGAARLAVHYEVSPHLHGTLGRIRSAGKKAGVAINPATPVDLLRDVLGDLDFVLVMSVNPGFGGQKFIPRALAKAERLAAMIAEGGHEVEIELDGGVDPSNIGRVAAAGAHAAVVGSALFGTDDPVATIAELKRAAARGQG